MANLGGYMDMRPLLLPLTSAEADVVLHALVSFATECEEKDDPCNDVPTADAVSDRIRLLTRCADEGIRQALLSMGMGVSKGRPQG